MPFVLIFIGLVVGISAYRGTESQLWSLLVNDFTGQGSFIYWVISIAIVGGIGYIPEAKKVSDAFIVLILVVFLISNQGFFTQFQAALSSSDATATPAPQDATSITGLNIGGGSSSNGSSSSNGGFDFGSILQGAGTIASFL